MSARTADREDRFPPAGDCGFLSPDDIEQLLDGTLAPARLGEIDRHVDIGCSHCALLLADVRTLRQVAEQEPSAAEVAASDLQADILRDRLRAEAARKPSAVRVAPARPGMWFRGWALAAAAVIVVGLAWLTLRDPGGAGDLRVPLPDGSVLVAQAKPFETPPVLRGEANLEDLWAQAGKAYEDGRFDDGASVLGEILERQPDSFDAALYHGVCLLGGGRISEARRRFEEARTLAAEYDLSTASLAYYEGLAALADGDRESASRSLDEAAAGTGPISGAARELLKELATDP